MKRNRIRSKPKKRKYIAFGFSVSPDGRFIYQYAEPKWVTEEMMNDSPLKSKGTSGRGISATLDIAKPPLEDA